MEIPEKLQQLIAEALAHVAATPDHDLPMEDISALGSAVGQLVDADHLRDAAHQRRGALVLLTLYHVLPLWEQVYPQDRLPHQVLQQAQQLLAGGSDWAAAQAAFTVSVSLFL